MTSEDYEADERKLKLFSCSLALVTFTFVIGSGIYGMVTDDYSQFFVISFCCLILALPMTMLDSHRADVRKWAKEERQRGN